MKKKVKYDSVIGFEEIDVRYYIHHQTKKNGKTYWNWKLEPTAQPIKLQGYDDFTFFIIKKSDRLWKISEALSGMWIYKTIEPESKAKAIENCLSMFKKKKITPEKMNSRVIERINEYGVSIRYRA